MPGQESISTSLVRALQACPDSVPMRRELLIATRHVLTTSVRGGNIPFISAKALSVKLTRCHRRFWDLKRPLEPVFQVINSRHVDTAGMHGGASRGQLSAHRCWNNPASHECSVSGENVALVMCALSECAFNEWECK